MNKLNAWLLKEISVELGIGILIAAVVGAGVMYATFEIVAGRQ